MLPSFQKKKKKTGGRGGATAAAAAAGETKKKPSSNLKKTNNTTTNRMVRMLYLLLVASIFSYVATYISFRTTQQHEAVIPSAVVMKKQQNDYSNSGTDTVNVAPATTNESFQTISGSSSSSLLLAPPRPHPHAGARYPDGRTWGYIADVTLARRLFIKEYQEELQIQNNSSSTALSNIPIRNYLPIKSTEEMSKVCNTPPTEGRERSSGWKLLTQKVKVFNQQRPEKKTRPIKVLCVVYTYEERHYILQSIVDTWGWRCDGFFAASTKTIIATNKTTVDGDDDSAYDSHNKAAYIIDLPHQGPEHYDNMWMKTRSIWGYIHDNFLDDFDFFYLSGDDTHVIVENLIHFLQSYDATRDSIQQYPLYLGHWIPTKDWKTTSNYFCGGGPGYVLNRKSVKILIEDVLPVCATNKTTSAEDRVLGSCFQSVVGIVCNNTVDNKGSQRFHGMDSQFVASFKGAKGYFKGIYEYWAQQFGGYKFGINLTSTESISFHSMKYPVWMKRHHAILYKSCPSGTALGDAL